MHPVPAAGRWYFAVAEALGKGDGAKKTVAHAHSTAPPMRTLRASLEVHVDSCPMGEDLGFRV